MRALLLLLALPCWGEEAGRLVVLADPHLPGRNLELKRRALEDINRWEDVEGVAVLGDLCNDVGSPEEYAAAKEFFSRLKKPLFPIPGNHDVVYRRLPDGKKEKAGPAERAALLERFKEAFGLPDARYSRKFGRYLALFVPNDDLESPYLAAISSGTLAWMDAELTRDKAPAMVFFHAPLKGTLKSRNAAAEKDSFVAQPAEALRALLKQHPQVFLWASGHTHVAPSNARFKHAVNLYDGRVWNIHNPDMDGRSYLDSKHKDTTDHDGLWSNSLFLYPDRVVVKTFDHRKGAWLETLTREIRPR